MRVVRGFQERVCHLYDVLMIREYAVCSAPSSSTRIRQAGSSACSGVRPWAACHFKTAFFEMRKEKVVAHIHHENSRSRNLFLGCGFSPCARSAHSTRYQLTLDDFLHPKARRTSEIT